ncbi:hypothetical protein AU375_02125 [Methylobacterium radiotolerans]|nr:hypothetical protein AU375_02125 [Methylobacterium radiotolerans]
MLRRDREECIADPAHGVVRRAQDPVLQNHGLAVADTLKRVRRGVTILRVDALEPSREIRHIRAGHAPDLDKGRAEVIEPPARQVGEPEDVCRMRGVAPKSGLALAQSRFGALLPIDVLHHNDGLPNNAIASLDRNAADAHPALVALTGSVQEAHVLHEFAPHRPRERVVVRADDPALRVEARPARRHLRIERGRPAVREESAIKGIGDQGLPVGPEESGPEREMFDQGLETRSVCLDLLNGASETPLRQDPGGGFMNVTEDAAHAAALVPNRRVGERPETLLPRAVAIHCNGVILQITCLALQRSLHHRPDLVPGLLPDLGERTPKRLGLDAEDGSVRVVVEADEVWSPGEVSWKGRVEHAAQCVPQCVRPRRDRAERRGCPVTLTDADGDSTASREEISGSHVGFLTGFCRRGGSELGPGLRSSWPTTSLNPYRSA